MKRESETVVSIAIITYNSADFILETLESAKNQTYKNIELIISDDCSTDNTIEICREWLVKNKDRFVKTKTITVEKNTGVAANCNRAIKAAKAEWIKFCAGDDLLLPDCIKDNMQFVSQNKDVKILFSQLFKFLGKFDLKNTYKEFPLKLPMNLMNPVFTAKDQFNRLLISDRITYTPSYFFNKQAIVSVGGYDEKTKYVEDYPMWLKLTKAGIRLYFMEKVTVAYRFHEASLNTQHHTGLFSQQYLRTEPMRRKYVYPNLPWDLLFQRKYNYNVSKFFDQLGLNKQNPLNSTLYKFFTVYTNPFQYIYSFKKHILKLGKSNIFYLS